MTEQQLLTKISPMKLNDLCDWSATEIMGWDEYNLNIEWVKRSWLPHLDLNQLKMVIEKFVGDSLTRKRLLALFFQSYASSDGIESVDLMLNPSVALIVIYLADKQFKEEIELENARIANNRKQTKEEISWEKNRNSIKIDANERDDETYLIFQSLRGDQEKWEFYCGHEYHYELNYPEDSEMPWGFYAKCNGEIVYHYIDEEHCDDLSVGLLRGIAYMISEGILQFGIREG